MPDSIDWEFIAGLEGKGVTTGYVPDATGSKSGVTIATGFDLGQRAESDLRTLGISETLITKFRPYLGLKGIAAVNFLKDNPLTITDDEAKEIDKKVKEQKVPLLKERYRTATENKSGTKFEDLPAQAQTVIASVAFQYGTLSTRTPKFWAAVTKQDWVEAVKLLRDFGDSYPTRRGKEADLLDQLNTLSEKTAALFARIPIWNLVVLFALLGIGCQTSYTQTKTIIFNENLAEAYKNFDRSAAEKRKEITFASGEKAETCAEYWRAKEKSPVKEDVAEMLYKSEYLVCDALQILRNSARTNEVTLETKSAADYGKEIYNRLDLNSFPSSLAQTSGKEKNTFKRQKSEMPSKVEPLSVTSDTAEWNFAVEVVAETDANANGKKDLIVYVIDESKEGNLKSYSTFLIYDVDGKGELKAVAPKN